MAANAAKTDAEVIIDGKVYTISGLESEEYIQKVASYLNGKLAELRKSDSYMRLSPDYRNVLLQLNIADDYFRMQQEKEEIRQDSATREKDLYDLKHELIATQMKLEKAEKDLKALREKNNENEKSVIRLETELKTRKDDKRI
jgi:cell division protein ZapA